MGHVNTKLHTVFPDTPSNPSQHIFGTIQEAIDAAESGSTIVLMAGDHSGTNGPIRMKSSLTFISFQSARIISSIVGEVSDIIFDNITFKNSSNRSIEFTHGKGYLFRNCEFQITMKGSESSKRHNIKFGFH